MSRAVLGARVVIAAGGGEEAGEGDEEGDGAAGGKDAEGRAVARDRVGARVGASPVPSIEQCKRRAKAACVGQRQVLLGGKGRQVEVRAACKSTLV